MSIPHHPLLNEMVALEQESWQVDDYLPVKITPELHENQINIELLISGTPFGIRSI